MRANQACLPPCSLITYAFDPTALPLGLKPLWRLKRPARQGLPNKIHSRLNPSLISRTSFFIALLIKAGPITPERPT